MGVMCPLTVHGELVIGQMVPALGANEWFMVAMRKVAEGNGVSEAEIRANILADIGEGRLGVQGEDSAAVIRRTHAFDINPDVFFVYDHPVERGCLGVLSPEFTSQFQIRSWLCQMQ